MALKVESLKKVFAGVRAPVQVLNGVSFGLEQGQSMAIQGPSGSGKSTLLHIIGTLDTPSSGKVLIGGSSPFDLDANGLANFRNSVIGFVFQDHHLLPQFSVLENILLPTITAKENRLERARFLLNRVGLDHRSDHRPGELSGGERQRAAIARALINQPSLLLCDEPTGNLDVDTANRIAELLFELHREQTTMMIAVTHSPDLASRFDRRVALRHGLLEDQ